MAASRVISVTNKLDGIFVDVVLDRDLAAGGKMYFSRVPLLEGWVECDPNPTLVGTHTYRARLPWSVGADEPAQLVYVTSWDSQGLSIYRDATTSLLAGHGAVWVGHTNQDEYTAIMKALLDRILDNIEGINARLRLIDSSIELKQVIWGMAEVLDKYPSVEINQTALDEVPYGANYSLLDEAQAEIYGYVVHQLPMIESELITAMGRALQRILNQDAYQSLVVVGCRPLARCRAENLRFDNNIWNGQRFVSNFSLTWRGEFPNHIP